MMHQRFLLKRLAPTTALCPQQRSISLLHKQATSPHHGKQVQRDLDHAIHLVRSHDPAGYLPGRLLPTPEMRTAYFAVRGFWVETGLRFGSTARVQSNATPVEHLEWWQQSVQDLTQAAVDPTTTTEASHHPTLRLLQHVLFSPTGKEEDYQWNKSHLDRVLQGRRDDLEWKQYPTLQHLEDHAGLSCGSLYQLVLNSGHLTPSRNPLAHRAARHVGVGHGLTNALRTGIPVLSTTGRLIVPLDLCQKHGVRTPRYLLSALGQGDTVAKEALQEAVREITLRAHHHFQEARVLRDSVLLEEGGHRAVPVFLPALASETFLERLAQSHHDLTDRDLRHVGPFQHWYCAARMAWAYLQKKY